MGLAEQYIGNLDAARDAYRQALVTDPQYAAAHINLSAVLAMQGDYESATDHAEQACMIAPDLPAAYIARARTLLQTGDTDTAMNFLHAGKERFGNLPELDCLVALCQKASGDHKAALALLQEIVRDNPDAALAWLELGHIERESEHYRAAATSYQRAVSLSPTFEARSCLAHCLYASDQIEPARTLYQELLAQNPASIMVLNNLGRLYERIGDVESARKSFNRVLELDPDNATSFTNLGRVYLAAEQFRNAEQAFTSAIERDAEDFHAFFGLGQALCELGRNQDAIDAFRAATEINKELGEAYYYISFLGGEVDDAVREKYVTDLFDRFAEKFDEHLVNNLQYRTPGLLHEAVVRNLGNQETGLDILDLGCGTGLCGPLFRPMSGALVGVDLSGKMVDKARLLDVYDELAVADVIDFMRGSSRIYDLIIAADVFVYFGDLADVFKAAQAALQPGGLYVFSTETCADGNYRLRKSGRHAHARAYIRELAAIGGFDMEEQVDCDLRLEEGKPIKGTIHVLRKVQDRP